MPSGLVVLTGSGRAFSAGDDITGRSVSFEGAQSLGHDVPRGAPGAARTYASLRGFSQPLNVAVRALRQAVRRGRQRLRHPVWAVAGPGL